MRRFKLLGSLSIHTGKALSPVLKSPKGCAIIIYLLVNGGLQPRELVADLLWEATSTAQSLKNLRSLLNRIRKWVPEVQVSRKTLAFEPLPDSDVDLYQLRAGLTTDDLATLDEALKLYTGELLATFYIADAPRFNEWLTVAREHLQRQVRDGYRRLCAGYNAATAWTSGVNAARRWVTIDPLDEEAQRTLMQLLVADGQIGAAQQQYETCRQLLWKELGVEPEAATQALAEQIAQLATPVTPLIASPTIERWSGETLPDPAPLPPRSLLPYRRNDDFIGRKNSLRTLARYLLLSENRAKPPVAAICGMGGMGKTQLAVEFAYRFGRYFAEIYWLSFADAHNVPKEIAHIGGERGMKLYQMVDKLALTDQIERVQQAWQSATPRLLIFDNCEDEALLEKWLPVTGGCHVLVTSRRGTWARELGVQVRHLTPLDRDEGIALLNQLAPTAAQADLATVGEISAELGDLPLALHLAGGFLNRYRHVSAAAYLKQLRERDLLRHPSLIGRGSDLSPTGHDLHIGRTFALNYNQLLPDDDTDALAIRLLTLIANFAHGEPIPQAVLLNVMVGAEADWSAELAAIDALNRLDALGFVSHKGHENVVMHRLIAAFVLVQATVEVKHEATDRVATTLRQLLSEEQKQAIYLGTLPLSDVHVRRVIANGLALHLVSAAKLSSWFGLHLIDTGAYFEAEPYVEQSIAILRRFQPAEALALAQSLNIFGTLLMKQGLIKRAWPPYEEGYEICRRELGDAHVRTINMLQNLAILHWHTNRLVEAKEMFETALRGHEALDPPQEQIMVRVLQNLGGVYSTLGDFAEAARCQERVLTIRRKTLPPNHPQFAENYNMLGVNAFRRGDYTHAAVYFQKAIDIRVEAFGANNYNTSGPLANLGFTQAMVGQLTSGAANLSRALEIRRATLPEQSPLVARIQMWLGWTYFHLTDYTVADSHLTSARTTYVQWRPTYLDTAETLVYSADLAIYQNDLTTARSLLDRAHAIYVAKHCIDSFLAGAYFNTLGELALKSAESDSARQHFEHAQQLLSPIVDPTHFELVRAVRNLAKLAT